MIAYAFGDEEVKLWETHKGPIPKDLLEGLLDDLQIIVAWHSSFERNAFKKHLGINIDLERWEDPMIRSRYMSMPGSLEKVGNILDIKSKKLTEFFIKDQSMIEMFCTPLRVGGYITLFGLEPTTYRDWETHPKEWKKFCEYCCIDVEAMREILHRLDKFPLPDFEYELFALNEEINDRGIYTDRMLIRGAGLIVDTEFENLRKEFLDLTGIAKPKSNKAVLNWVRQHGYTFPSLGKPFVNRALAGECPLDEVGKKGLKLRLQLSKSSVSKLEALIDAREDDFRVRGLFNFMGAARTGRWTSGIVQVQNLVKSSKEVEKKYDLALALLRAGDYDSIKKEFSSPIDVACAAIRPIFKASPNNKLVVSDLSAIETRGAAWVSGCEPLMEVFRQGRDPYIAFAVQMDPTRSYEELYAEYKAGNKTTRTNAKPPTLGCGYGLTPGIIDKDEDGNIVKTGLLGYADSMGIELAPEYAEKAVMVYRNTYREVVQFWYDLHSCFVDVIENGGIQQIGPLAIEQQGRVICLWLPSGRALHYINPEVIYSEKVSPRNGRSYKTSEIMVDGVDQKTHHWGRIKTYGSKIFENVVQAICRDILGYGMIAAKEAGFPIVLTCHDEIVAEVPENGILGVKELVQCMTRNLDWCPGFIIGAEGFETEFYKKE
jgi:DNA polymerase